MSKEHIEKRFEQYQEKRREVERLDRLERKAADGALGMLELLKMGIRENVSESNGTFREVPHSRCDMQEDSSGFRVTRTLPRSTLHLVFKLREESSFIDVLTADEQRDASVKKQPSQIEIRADAADGFLLYVFQGEEYRAAEADRLAVKLLDPILPGPNDLAPKKPR